jgi:glycine C-acetyltransferase
MKKSNIDPNNGLPERSFNIEDFLEAQNVGVWSKPKGINIFERSYPAADYVERQRAQEMWLYNRRLLTGPATEVLAMDDNNNILYGINFASADYLGLAQNTDAKEAAIEAATTFGVNSAGSPLAFGATKYPRLHLGITCSCGRNSRISGASKACSYTLRAG